MTREEDAMPEEVTDMEKARKIKKNGVVRLKIAVSWDIHNVVVKQPIGERKR